MECSFFVEGKFEILSKCIEYFYFLCYDMRATQLNNGQSVREVFLFLVKTHSLFWLSLIGCQRLCRNNRSVCFSVHQLRLVHFFI